MTRADFIAAATAAAQASSAHSGFPPGVTVAQAALESAWGASQLSRRAHNYFGIKAHGTLPWIEMLTHEFEEGKLVRVAARFARYESIDHCFADRDQLIARLGAYQEVRGCAADPEAFLRALARRWATDPAYAEKLQRLYRTHGFDALDRPSSAN
ncbi:MAG: glycoside hydrolase family 73 protein [Terriglobales bacterium]